jgi:hypothetical protein
MNLSSAVGYAIFPLSEAGAPDGFQNQMHIVVTILVVVSAIVSLILIAVGSRLKSGDSVLGVVERLSVYAAVGFTCFLGIRCMCKAIK